MEPLPIPAVVALLGAECTGKTTLSTQLVAAFDGVLVPEYLRAFVDEHGRTPTVAEQFDIMRMQIRWESAAIERAQANGSACVVADPAAMQTAVYSMYYFNDDSLLAEALAHQQSYCATLWCRPDLPWTSDGAQRDGPDARRAVDDLIGEIVGARGLTVIEIAGPRSSRLRMAKSVVAGCQRR